MISDIQSQLAAETASYRSIGRDIAIFKGRGRSGGGGSYAGYSNPVTTSGTGMLGMAELGMGLDTQTARHFEQYKYFKDWCYTAIRPIATRIAGQQIFVARAPLNGHAFSRLKELSLESPEEAWALREKCFYLKQSLPDCFKNLGERLAPIENHPLLQLLQRPNEIMFGWQLMFASACSLHITGECLWWLDDFDIQHFGNKGGTWKLWPIPSHWCTPEHDPPAKDGSTPGKLFARWRIRSPRMSQAIIVEGSRMIYYYYPDPSDPLAAMSPMQACSKAIATDEQIQSSQYYSMRDGLRPEVILTAGRMPGPDGREATGMRPVLTAEQRSQLIEAIKLAHRGVQRRGEPAIIDGLIEGITPFSRTPHEMDFLESSKLQKDRIFQSLGVNPITVGQIEGANRASAAVADENFCSNVMQPLSTLMSQVMTGYIGPLFAGPNEILVVWIDPCRPRDTEMKLREWTTFASDATPNERRKHILNLPERPEPEADMPGFMRPVPVSKPGGPPMIEGPNGEMLPAPVDDGSDGNQNSGQNGKPANGNSPPPRKPRNGKPPKAA